MKAVLITYVNQGPLMTRYGIDPIEKDERMPIGYIFVADFGEERPFDVLTPENFNKFYEKTGNKLQNNFFEVVKK